MSKITKTPPSNYTGRKRQTGPDWKAKTVILRNVPISYMKKLNSAMFIPAAPGFAPEFTGDRAVVRFDGQSWDSPSVIGFESYPRVSVVNFYIGKSTSPFSEYTRDDVGERTYYYLKTMPASRLDSLAEGQVKLLILPCPIRVLSDEELSAIQAYRANGGRVVLFAGDNLTAANDVLGQLGSVFEVKPSQWAHDIWMPSGFFDRGDGEEMFWIPGAPTGWVNPRQAYWPTATLKDFNGYGLLYNGNVCTIMYNTWFQQYYYPYPAIHCSQQRTWLQMSPAPTVYWGRMGEVETNFPDGYGGSYAEVNAAAWDSWLASNSGRLPFLKLAPNDYEMPTIELPYGNIWDIESARDTLNEISPLISYAQDNLIVCAMKPSWFTGDTGNYEMIAYYFHTVEFMDWLIYGNLTMHDYFHIGATSAAIPPYYGRSSSEGGWFYPATQS